MGRNKSRRDEFGFIVPKKFNFETIADVIKKEKKLNEVRADHKEIQSIIKYKPQKIAYVKHKGTVKQLENFGYKRKSNGWIKKLEDGNQFHAIVKGDLIYLHKDIIKNKKHIASIEDVPREIKLITCYARKVSPMIAKNVTYPKNPIVKRQMTTKRYFQEIFRKLIHLT